VGERAENRGNDRPLHVDDAHDQRGQVPDEAERKRKEEEDKRDLTSRLIALGAFFGVGIGAEALYAAQMADGLTLFALALLTGLAAFVAAGLIGFLFGIPRTLSSEAGLPGEGTALDRSVVSSIRANTNLEQISDWLTKILVGVTLTQLGTIREGAAALFDAVGSAYGDQPSNPVFAGVVIVYFGGGGFVGGWMFTRLRLGRWMRRADKAELEVLAADAAARGDDEAAIALRAKARAIPT